MPTKLISPKKYRKTLYTVPRRRKVAVQVEASAPVSIYGVDEEDLESFRDGHKFSGFNFVDKRVLDKEITLPFEPGDEWYLVIENESDETPVAVHYEVYDVA